MPSSESEGLRLPEIDYIKQGHFSKPADTEPRPVTDHSFDYSLVLEFATMEDHERYQSPDDPDHPRFVSTCKDLWDRVLVYDSAPING